MAQSGPGWDARVEAGRMAWRGIGGRRAGGGHFADEAEALAWCERMVGALARDAGDEDERG